MARQRHWVWRLDGCSFSPLRLKGSLRDLYIFYHFILILQPCFNLANAFLLKQSFDSSERTQRLQKIKPHSNRPFCVLCVLLGQNNFYSFVPVIYSKFNHSKSFPSFLTHRWSLARGVSRVASAGWMGISNTQMLRPCWRLLHLFSFLLTTNP